MKQCKKVILKSFTPDQSYAIAKQFFSFLKPHVQTHFSSQGVECLDDLLSNQTLSLSWNEAVRKLTTIQSEGQQAIHLFIPAIFQCVIHFCAFHATTCKSPCLILQLFNLMQQKPQHYLIEWSIWEKAVEAIQDLILA